GLSLSATVRAAAEMLDISIKEDRADGSGEIGRRGARQVRLLQSGEQLLLVNFCADGPNILMDTRGTPKQQPSEQDKKIIWAVDLIMELILGILSICAIPVKGGNGLKKIVAKILNNPKIVSFLAGLSAGLTAKGILDFFKSLYDEGILGDLLKEI